MIQRNRWISVAAAAALMVALAGCNATQGEDGNDGIAGTAGASGSDGAAGVDGTDGVDGADGSDGTDGTDAMVVNIIPSDRLASGATVKEVVFAETKVPYTDAEKAALGHTASVWVDGVKETVNYGTIMKTGYTDTSGEMFGLSKDYQDNNITFSDSSPYICNGTNDGQGSGLDYFSILEKNNKLFMVSQFECAVGSMYVNQLAQDQTTGALSVVPGSLKFVSQKAHNGGFVHCAGQTTPWASHLGSEEYETDARNVETNRDATTGLVGDSYFDELAKYWGNDATKANPYFYGWSPEVTIDGSDNAVYTKHYSMGRFSHELSYVMPDQKTVYMSDDGTNVGLFMYVADAAQNLSAGTLYAAKWIQTSQTYGGKAMLEWVKLAQSDDATIKAYVDQNLSFSDLFTADTVNTDNTCNTGYTAVNTSAGLECLKLTPAASSALSTDAQVEEAAAYLETRRYAAYKGATTEFRKEEGITYDPEHKRLHIAMSAVAYGMEDYAKKSVANTKYDKGGNNDIRLPYNPCGAVYALDMNTTTVKDTAGTNISGMVATNMYAVIAGQESDYQAGEAYEGNECLVDGISNPDNITYLPGTNILAIGEDTGSHDNNMVWAFNVETGELTRILTTPLGAETTSPFWHLDANSSNTFDYITITTQHPDGATDTDKQSEAGVLYGPTAL